ncbi:nucleopolyhedrovirus P10 family protein [Streptomyces minutiscleroticus]|uniref:nucleopolyhedrovirus P10 family protein n=1 Tax=Streptomyces minutiscleroticus TaxID=68238 RepID=UPI00332CD6EB
MTADGWTRAVRRQLGLGRLLPLGGPRDGAWLTESAAEAVLRRAVRHLPGVRLGALRFSPAEPDGPYDDAVPRPPGALPPGPLRLDAGFDAVLAHGEPLPSTAARLRAALAGAAAERLGLTVAELDLRVTGLLGGDGTEDEGEAAGTGAHGGGAGPGRPGGKNGLHGSERATRSGPPDGPAADGDAGEDDGPGDGGGPSGDEARVAAAARAVPGVVRLTGVLAEGWAAGPRGRRPRRRVSAASTA